MSRLVGSRFTPGWVVKEPERLRASALVLLLVALAPIPGLGPIGLAVFAALLGVGSWRLARALFRPAALVDAAMLTWTLSFAWIAVAAELLSLGRLLGQPTAWVAVGGAWALAGLWVLPRGPLPALPSPRVALASEWSRLHWAAQGLLLVFGLQLATAFVLTFFAGINVWDNISAYLPRATRIAQAGTVDAPMPYVGFLQYLAQVVAAIQFTFLRSDALVNPFSFVTALMAGLGIFALARSLLPNDVRRSWLALGAATAPFTMPMVLLHASTSNFDIFAGQWLLYALYFLRRGYAATRTRWLVAAALATALGLATKPTFWFAVPGLGLLWAWAFARPMLKRARRRGASRRPTTSGRTFGDVARSAALCAVLVVVVGTPFLWHNAVARGYLIAPAANREIGTAGGATLGDRFRLLGFGSAVLGLELLTPPFLLPRATAEGLDDQLGATMRSLGVRLPDPILTPHAGWDELIRHVSHRYDANHAGFGAAFPLLIVPALALAPFAGRRLGPRRVYGLAVAFLGVSYFVVINTVTFYSNSNVRYLSEMVLVLVPLAGLLFLFVPRRLAGPLAAALATALLIEMHGVVVNDKQKPLAQVTVVPRDEQFAVFNGNPPTQARAARVFDRKYPAAEYPDVFVHDTGAPNFPEYTFFGPTLERRAASWLPRDDEIALPGLVLTRELGGLDRFVRSGAAVVDRLGVETWLLVPNDRLRVVFGMLQPTPGGDPVLRLTASVPPDRYRAPMYGVFVNTNQGDVKLRDFSPDPTCDVPLDQAARGTVRVEVRDGENGRTQERVRVERPKFMGL